jgi:hypothetical protein
MKRVKISLSDLLIVLQAMQDDGTEDVIVFEHNGMAALCDADETENIITFQAVDETDDSDESKNDSIH